LEYITLVMLVLKTVPTDRLSVENEITVSFVAS